VFSWIFKAHPFSREYLKNITYRGIDMREREREREREFRYMRDILAKIEKKRKKTESNLRENEAIYCKFSVE
jgi:hypothetical protein